MAAELDGCEALVSFAAIGAAPVANFAGRGWNEQEWAAAHDRLALRGLVDADGQATERGRSLRDQVERWQGMAGRIFDLLCGQRRSWLLTAPSAPDAVRLYERSGWLRVGEELGRGGVRDTWRAARFGAARPVLADGVAGRPGGGGRVKGSGSVRGVVLEHVRK
ncbi:hypothetical protein GCM10022224_033240 [Nonomuraea antimicrobica]|uniref:N-acetyltransferase domain-containing protein n=2 Tax=Nonomuraea antimicrobica TaxID=561173 RepID=A0ABP7BS64_9ACTN